MNIDLLVKQMSLQEKAAQLTQFGAFLMKDPDHPEMTGNPGKMQVSWEEISEIGSTFNFSGPQTRKSIQKEHLEHDPNHIPLVFMQDVIHGYRTIYPIPLAMAASFDPSLVKEMAAMAAEEAVAAGVDVTFSPMADLSRDARWGRAMEGAGEDIHLNCVMAEAQVKGYLSKGLQSCVKHYAAYGAVEAGRDYNMTDMSETRLRERYLPAYKAAIDAGAKCIMPSYNSLNGVPSVANKLLMNTILREEWNFDGIVVSDYGAVDELISHGIAKDSLDSAQYALECGCNLEMMSTNYCRSLQALLDEGRVTMDQIDRLVLQLLRFKQEIGLFENPDRKADETKLKVLALSEENRSKARRAAECTSVLLKNEDVLPFSDKAKKVAVIGPFGDDGMIQGAWAMNGIPEETVTVLTGIRNRMPSAEVRYAQGCSRDLATTDVSGIADAADLAAWADQVILTLGEGGEQSGECESRSNLELSDAQKALFRAVSARCPHTAVLLMCGRPLAIRAIAEEARAILCMWQPGTEGGNAAASLLYGDVCPSGRLPMSFPFTTGQEPLSYDMYHTGRLPLDIIHSEAAPWRTSYRDCPIVPLYPFGYGLTYTTFALEDEHISADRMTATDSLAVSARIRNTGKREAACVPQLYLRDCVGSRVRPIRELKDFKKIYLKPGEEASVSFLITEPMLRFETLSHGYSSEKGLFEAVIAFDAYSGNPLSFELV